MRRVGLLAICIAMLCGNRLNARDVGQEFFVDSLSNLYCTRYPDVLPVYLGGEQDGSQQGMSTFISDFFRLFDDVEINEHNNITRIVFGAVIDSTGTLRSPRLVKDYKPQQEQLLIRVFERLPELHVWRPGEMDGKPVNTYMVFPINVHFRW